MNKSALKRFAITMRLDLIAQIETKITFLLSDDYKKKLSLYESNKHHIQKIRERYEQDNESFIEEVAYRWFNRFIALRFMEVNDIGLGAIVSTSSEYPLPQLFMDAKAGEIEDELNLDRDYFFDLIDNNIAGIKEPDNEAYKHLFISVCNYYGSLMPTMFESISDYSELLLPDDMLSPHSLRAKVVEAMSKEDCQDIEIIGWLYQFYISQKKDDVFAELKKNKKITPSNIPAATQLFTPHWIVKYMVENSLGRLWMLNNPNSNLKEQMSYYIDNSQESDTFIKVDSVEELTLLDPCCGSGHTLTYAFDLLTKIYEEEGYSKREIPSLILKNNLFGCDIDKRASTLAYFALVMKARLYHRRFFKNMVKPNIIELDEYGSEEFSGIKNFGSLLKPSPKKEEVFDDGLFGQSSQAFKLQEKILSSEFHCVVTNPPYMGSKGMNKELSNFVKKNYKDSKSDLFAVFMERTLEMTKPHGFMSMINQHSWMFLSSYEKLRVKIIENHRIDTLVHLGARAFEEIGGEVVQSVAFVLEKDLSLDTESTYIRLTNYKSSEKKEQEFFNFENRYEVKQEDFNKISKSPIAYWIDRKWFTIFRDLPKLNDLSISSEGIKTGNNESFLRLLNEINMDDIGGLDSHKKWILHHKGGEFRKWYGNIEHVIFWKDNGSKIKSMKNSGIQGQKIFNEDASIWSDITSGGYSARLKEENHLFDSSSPVGFIFNLDNKLLLSFLNSSIVTYLTPILNPTLHFKVGNFNTLPFNNKIILKNQEEIKTLSQQNINISKEEWDSRETSWDFTKNELIKHKLDSKIATAYTNYCNYWQEQFFTLHQNEEELNRLFIDIYELQDELTPDVALTDITILKNEAKIEDGRLVFQAEEIMKQFVSYGVGVMLGRYSLDSKGLLIANMGQELPTETTFEIDDDNIIPVLEEDYFRDDIASRFVQFVKMAFGEEHLNENIGFIEKGLGKSIRNYFVKGFYEDHLKRYKKRPIYWMVSSPKKEFMALLYMHRYQSDIFGRVRNSYLTEYITKLEAHKESLHLIRSSETATNSDKKRADRELKKIEKKLTKLIEFDRDVMMGFAQNNIEIDLDDGVKVNYCKFKQILYPITGVCK